MRKTLNADSLLGLVHQDFRNIADTRAGNAKIPLDDALMAALAMFQLKDPSLLAFDKRRLEEPDNLRAMFGITVIPCDSQMRTTLDPLPLDPLRGPVSDSLKGVAERQGFREDGLL